MSEHKRNMVRIETDESGYMKAVTFDGKVLPVFSFTASASTSEIGHGPFIAVDLEMLPSEWHATAAVGQISLMCPVCESLQSHECFDGRVDDADGYSDDPKY